jgi:hypothetical protein
MENVLVQLPRMQTWQLSLRFSPIWARWLFCVFHYVVECIDRLQPPQLPSSTSTNASKHPSNLCFCSSMVVRAQARQAQARCTRLHRGFDFEPRQLPPTTRRLHICRSYGVDSAFVAPSSTDARRDFSIRLSMPLAIHQFTVDEFITVYAFVDLLLLWSLDLLVTRLLTLFW